MARYFMALGPFHSRDAAERARAGMTESDALRASVLRLRDKPQAGRRVFKAEVSMTRRADGAWDTTTKLFGAAPVRLIVHCGDDPGNAAADALNSAIDDREDES